MKFVFRRGVLHRQSASNIESKGNYNERRLDGGFATSSSIWPGLKKCVIMSDIEDFFALLARARDFFSRPHKKKESGQI